MEAYRIEHVSFSYPETTKNVLHNINVTIKAGEFVTVCGKSGSGKSTLLRQLKPVLTPHGKREGRIFFFEKPLEKIDPKKEAADIGYVMQHPDNQIVTDKVWHELAFGLESLGYDSETIRLRVAEMASFFGIQTWFHKKVTDLSGGQKQILNLAAIMAMQPSVLILDEPTSMLDPIAAHDFLQTVKRINDDLGVTVIMSEHRLEEVLPLADRMIVMDKGKIIADDCPQKVGKKLSKKEHPMFMAMPTPMKIVEKIEPEKASYPLTINEARQWLTSYIETYGIRNNVPILEKKRADQEVVIELKDVWFRYDKNERDVIKDLSLDVRQGELYCIVGGNGTGKSTALSIMSGVNKPYRGRVHIYSENNKKRLFKSSSRPKVTMLPQNPQHVFVKKTVQLDLEEMLLSIAGTEEEKRAKLQEVIALTELDSLLSRHPYDLSGGEQQRAALAKVLLLDAPILLLDEPTKGLDAFFKKKFAHILKKLLQQNKTIVLVSHDVEFCAAYAHVCALFFDGAVVTSKPTRSFFSGNSFYTTAANRIARHICTDVVTTKDVVTLCKKG